MFVANEGFGTASRKGSVVLPPLPPYAAVRFMVDDGKEGDSYCVVGSAVELGQWKTDKAFWLKYDGSSNWTGEVSVPSEHKLEYRLCRRQKEDDDSMIVGEIGNVTLASNVCYNITFKKDESDMLIKSKWLKEEYQIRFLMGDFRAAYTYQPKDSPKCLQSYSPFENMTIRAKVLKYNKFEENGDKNLLQVKKNNFHAHNNTNAGITIRASMVEKYVDSDSMPLRDGNEFRINVATLDNLVIQLQIMDSQGDLLGSGNLCASNLFSSTSSRDLVQVAITNDSGVFGEISVSTLVITPWIDSVNNLQWVENRMPKAGLKIGHRGNGSNKAIKVKNAQKNIIDAGVRENTIRSFNDAHHSGTQWVEFDVQPTKDNQLVLYHDIELNVSKNPKVDVPVRLLMYEEMNHMFSEIRNNNSHRHSLRSLKSDSDLLRHNNINSNNHNNNNCGYEENNESLVGDEEIFPLLRHAFELTLPELGFNIEIKYAELEEIQKRCNLPDRNTYLNLVLSEVFAYANDRKIFFSSFDPDICIMLAEKQVRYPVFILHDGDGERFPDARFNFLNIAINTAHRNGLRGVVVESKAVFKDEAIVQRVHDKGLLLYTYGGCNNEKVRVELQEKMKVDGIIMDHTDYFEDDEFVGPDKMTESPRKTFFKKWNPFETYKPEPNKPEDK